MLKFNSKINYYKILGVKPSADLSEIKSKFKKKAVTEHPDRIPTIGLEGETQAERLTREEKIRIANENFKSIQEAYETLKDPEKRKLYDAQYHKSNPVSTEEPRTGQQSQRKNKNSSRKTGGRVDKELLQSFQRKLASSQPLNNEELKKLISQFHKIYDHSQNISCDDLVNICKHIINSGLTLKDKRNSLIKFLPYWDIAFMTEKTEQYMDIKRKLKILLGMDDTENKDRAIKVFARKFQRLPDTKFSFDSSMTAKLSLMIYLSNVSVLLEINQSLVSSGIEARRVREFSIPRRAKLYTLILGDKESLLYRDTVLDLAGQLKEGANKKDNLELFKLWTQFRAKNYQPNGGANDICELVKQATQNEVIVDIANSLQQFNSLQGYQSVVLPHKRLVVVSEESEILSLFRWCLQNKLSKLVREEASKYHGLLHDINDSSNIGEVCDSLKTFERDNPNIQSALRAYRDLYLFSTHHHSHREKLQELKRKFELSSTTDKNIRPFSAIGNGKISRENERAMGRL